MAVFTPQPQAGSVALELTYLTEISRSDDGTEQRVMDRSKPLRRMTYSARRLDTFEAGWLRSLIYGGHNELLTVPYWPHATRLIAAASPGSNVPLLLDTTDRDFRIGSYAILMLDENTVEQITVGATSSTSVTASTLAGSWAADTIVSPATRGRWTGNVIMDRLSPRAVESPVDFLMEPEPTQVIAVATSANIFTVVPINDVEAVFSFERLVDRIQNDVWSYQDFQRRDTPIGGRVYELWLDSRAVVSDLIDWFHARRGRLKPFWMPTFQQDFDIVSGLGTASLTVKSSGYTTYMTDSSRRQLAFCEPNGTITHREVTSVVNNGNGTETLTLDGTAPAGTSKVSFLLYGRLESDTLRIEWDNSVTAQCTISFIELPNEVP